MKLIKLFETAENIYLHDFLIIYFFPSENKGLEDLCAFSSTDGFPHAASETFLQLPILQCARLAFVHLK